MKKHILSFLLIATFGMYVAYQRLSGSTDISYVPAVTTSSTTTHPKTDPTLTIAPSVKSVPPPTPPTPVKVTNTGQYVDGQYTGISADAYYGNIQVEATISGGKLTDVTFLDYPQDRGTSISINRQAMPRLRSEAIQAQSANVNTVSGATDSSGAFRQSLASALSQAKNS